MKIYFTVDEKNRVYPCCDWSADIEPDEGWIEGALPDGSPAMEAHGVPLWKYVDDAIVKRTDAEVQEDIDAIPVPEPTEIEQMRADVDYLLMLAEE